MRPIDADTLKRAHGMGDDCAECDKETRRKSTTCEYDRAYTLMDFCGWIDDAPTVKPKLEPDWIPILDGDGQMPEVDDKGYSDYILLSFRNASFLCIGQYREDEEGGAFYDGDDENPLTKMGLFVNAWMPLPEPYKAESEEV